MILERSIKNRRAGGAPAAGEGTVAAPARPRAAFALLATVQVVLVLAITVVAVALPAIQRDLGLGRADLVLLSAAYGLAFSGLLLLGGRLADLLGHRRVLLLGVATFGLAAAAAGLAPGRGALLAARFTQGAGAALAAPAAMALLGSVFPDPRQRARALAAWGGLASTGATAGTLLGGAAAAWASWRWALALPAAAAAAAVLAAPRLLPPGPPPAPARLDLPGALLATAGLAALSYGLVTTLDRGWSSPAALAPLAAGGALLAALAAVESRAPAPLVPPAFLASPRRAVALLAVLLTAAGTAATTFFLTLYLQQVRGLSPLRTSAAFLPYGLALAGAGLAAGRLVGRAGARAVTAAGLALAAAGLLLLSRIGSAAPPAGLLLAGLLTFPAGASLAFAGATVAAATGVPDHQAGLAGGVVNTALEAGPTVGLALLASLAGTRTARLAAAGASPAAAASGGYGFALAAAAAALALTALITACQQDPQQRRER